MDKLLTIFIYVWVGLIVALNIFGIAAMFYLHGFSAGLEYVQTTYSPFNLVNWAFTIVTLLPAIGAGWWRERRRAKERQKILAQGG